MDYDKALLLFKAWFDMLNSMGIFNEDVMEDMYANAALYLVNTFPDSCTYGDAHKDILA